MFPIRRLSQMASVWSGVTGIPSQDLLSNVHIEQCYNIDDAQAILVLMPNFPNLPLRYKFVLLFRGIRFLNYVKRIT